jgi:transposase
MPAKTLYAEFVGIDVSKSKLDVYETKSKTSFCVSNDKEGLKRLLSKIVPNENLLVLIDLTGGYEMLAVKECVAKGYNVHRAQGRKVKKFIELYGQKAKTDKIDSKMLTVYGAKMQERLRLYQARDTKLQELVSRRQDIMDMLQKENCRKEHFIDKVAQSSVDEIINVLQRQLKVIEQEIRDFIDKDKELKEKAEVIKSVKSVGDVTAMTLLTLFPELGKINRKKAAALAGLAPYANDSGKNSKKRKTSIGRPLVKRALFMCALVAIKHNSILSSFYKRLRERGKIKMIAIVAVMRKLLVFINNRCKEFYFKRAICIA